ncbi:MAG: sulfatase-like hydrolase/transferase [Porticoccaceae bacterium]|nr:sulfatase-like hydrolase/transferase [Porticoccaceae bacterium]
MLHLIRVLALLLSVSLTANSAVLSTTNTSNNHADDLPPPNFIIIYTDDMGYADAGPFTQTTIDTPWIDSLAENGQVWSDFYAAASVCTPSRGALLTGNLPVRTGLYGDNIAVFFPGAKAGLPAMETTIAEMFKQYQYATGLFGKWHLGDSKEYYPTRHGFDEWVGIPYSNDMDWEVEGITSSNIFNPPQEAAAKYQIVAGQIWKDIFDPDITDWQVPLIRSLKSTSGVFVDQILEKPANQSLITQRYTDESIRFITSAAAKQQPFFIMLSHSMPHVPLFRSPAFINKSQQGIYGDVIEEIDWSVGQILTTLETLNIHEQTYVVFTNDNGPWLIYGDHAGTAKPLKNGKGTTFEGGMRVMTLFNGPNIKTGVVKGLGMQTDFFSTFAALAGFDKPLTAKDSVDLSDTLLQKKPSQRTFVPFYKGSELRAFRLNDHKLHFITAGAYGQMPPREVHTTPVLINLTNDLGESTNIAAEYPKTVKKITSFADKFQQSVPLKTSIIDRQFMP